MASNPPPGTQRIAPMLAYAVLLFAFSPWAVVILIGAGLPSFFAEAKFSGDAFRLFRWRSPDTRMQMYLETVIAREDGVKEVKLFQLGPRLLQRYRDIFKKLFIEDRRLTLRRDTWGFILGLLSTAALYGAREAMDVLVIERAAIGGQAAGTEKLDKAKLLNHGVKVANNGGANAVCVGRPYVWGLGSFGQAGVEQVLAILRAEFRRVMQEAGVTSVSQIDSSHIEAA